LVGALCQQYPKLAEILQPKADLGEALSDLPDATVFNGNGAPRQPSVQSRGASKKLAYAIAYARHGIRVFPCHEIESDGYCSCGANGLQKLW
jgi:hypothetical protein